MKKFDPKRKVWIIKPYCHGNGGWYGWGMLSSKRGMQLRRALKVNPLVKYDLYNDHQDVGTLSAVLICFKPEPNSSLFRFHGGNYRWEKLFS